MRDALPEEPQAEELVEILMEGRGLRLERIVSTGQATPEDDWYDLAWDEFVVLVSGAARLRIEGEDEDRALEAGDWVLLPAHCRHRVTWTQTAPPAVWLAIHHEGALSRREAEAE
ncbi:MAG: cupin domain-containing protein [Methyloceanibacter sp.]|uniref:cupin domain-containing protein n=1 Tax=Methyloceanibacter sp. TaxID=1965321 RepID=UPI003EE09F4C